MENHTAGDELAKGGGEEDREREDQKYCVMSYLLNCNHVKNSVWLTGTI